MEIRRVFDVRRFSPEKMQKVGLFASPRLGCDLYCLEPGQAQKPHRHPESDKVYLVLEGRARFQLGEESEALRPGEAVLAPAGEDHGVSNDASDRLVLLVLMAPPPTHA